MMTHVSSSFLACYISSCFTVSTTLPTHTSTLSLHDALPISSSCRRGVWRKISRVSELMIGRIMIDRTSEAVRSVRPVCDTRSEEHTSELQSRGHLVCRLLLEKKKQTNNIV